MADANGHHSVPQLPPLEFDGAIESQQPAQQLPVVRFAETDQLMQRASINNNSTDHSSPPPRIIASYPSTADDGSLSSVTNNTTPGITAAAVSRQRRTPHAATSPATPDFSRPQSDANAYLSGDDEDEWEREADMVMASIGELVEASDVDQLTDIAYEEITEFDQILQEAEDEGGGEGEEEEYETINVTIKTYSVAQLKEVAKTVSVATGGNKSSLFARIRDSGSEWIVKGDSDKSFEYKKVKVNSRTLTAVSSEPYWLTLNPEIPPPIDGVDMATGASIGFFGPTNTNNIAGAQRHNFLTHPLETIQRPSFASIDQTRPTQDVGSPSILAKKAIGDIKTARPIDFFSLIITPRFVEKTMVACTNQKAAGEGAGVGGTVYTDFVQFDVNEMYRFLGLLFANGLAPKPDFRKWFETSSMDPLLGSDFIAPLMNKKLPGRGVVPGVRRWKHFRRFLCFYDPRIAMTKQSAEADPLWKVRLLLKQLNKQSMAMWIPGKHVSVDEQTIAFKGRSSMKLRISYKKEGDGFQCDAICDRGYTFAFYFRHGEPPKLPSHLDDLKLPPTARRVVWLAQQLPNHWTRIYMDNLFNSQKLFSALYRVKALAHGVMRMSGRGFPPSVKQDEEKNANKAERLKGTTKAAILKNSVDTPNMIAASVYDNKPVHLMSTVIGNVEWVGKKRKVWSAAAGASIMMSHMRLNLIDEYNQYMNSTDIADQLRNTYRPDHWMRNKKWWWAIFIWAIGVARVNAYKIYVEMFDDAKRQKEKDLPPLWNHREFIHELVLDLMSYDYTTIMSKK